MSGMPWWISLGLLAAVAGGSLLARGRRVLTGSVLLLAGLGAAAYGAWQIESVRANVTRLADEFAANKLEGVALVATALLGTGLWLLLPRGEAPGRRLGMILTALGLGLFGAMSWIVTGEALLGDWLETLVFWTLAVLTIGSAVATVTFRNPVYSAIWFAMMLLGTAGLFLFLGAQFLAVATVVVYAGAILVTFLFVLMLANPKGRAFYDRLSWEPMLAGGAGAVLIGILTMTLTTVFLAPAAEKRPQSAVTVEARQGEVLAAEHMAHLGRQLFGRHLVGVEVAGVLLLVALVGSVAILAEPPREAERSHDAHE